MKHVLTVLFLFFGSLWIMLFLSLPIIVVALALKYLNG